MADSVRTALSSAIANSAPPVPHFPSTESRLAYLRWLSAMSDRLYPRVRNLNDRIDILQTVWYETKRAGLDTSGKADLSGFTDASGVSPYAADAMGWCVKSGLIGGTDAGALEPRGAATRAQCAAILARFEKLLPNGNGAKR